MPSIQNISEEIQTIRIQGEKKQLKPGEIAEVLDQEVSVVKTYPKLFQIRAALDEPSVKQSFKSKKELAEYALTLGIKLDQSKKMTEMQADLDTALAELEAGKEQE